MVYALRLDLPQNPEQPPVVAEVRSLDPDLRKDAPEVRQVRIFLYQGNDSQPFTQQIIRQMRAGKTAGSGNQGFHFAATSTRGGNWLFRRRFMSSSIIILISSSNRTVGFHPSSRSAFE